MENKKTFFESKINWVAIIMILTSVLPLISETNFGEMTGKSWITFTLGIVIIILRTYFTNCNAVKAFFKSKINWMAIIAILTSLIPLIDETNFGEMTVVGWITFIIGVLILILRTWFTSTTIVAKK